MTDKLGRVYAVAVVALLLGSRVPLAAQQSRAQRQFDKLAEKVAKSVGKTDAVNILIAPFSGCLGQPELCADFDAVLHTSLQGQIPAAKFIDREDAVKHLADHGFLSIDAYLGALNNVGREAGADVVIGEKFERDRNSCNLKATVTDAKRLYELGEFSTSVSCAAANKTTLSLLKDPSAGIFLIVPLPASPASASVDSHIAYPACLSCPDPHYTGDAQARGIQGSVQILMTVTDQGTVENARVLGFVETGLAMASMRAVSGWRLKPAAGPDGRPFKARVLVEVNFRLAY